MASIHERQRSDGTTAYQVKWREDGKGQSRTCDTPAAAKRLKALVDAHGTYLDEMGRDDVPTVAQVFTDYLATATRASAVTLRDYRRLGDRHIIPVLGELAITAVTPAVVRTWANGLGGKLKSRRNVFGLLSGVLATAVPEYLPANPCKGIRLREDPTPDERHLLTSEELAVILEEIPEHYRPLVATLAGTGMRWGEVAALTVGDADLRADPPYLRVSKAVKHRSTQRDAPGTPKTKRSNRRVILPAQLPPVIAPLLDRPRDAPLFPTPRGNRIRNSTFHTKVWQPAMDRATDREVHGDRALAHRYRIHDLRAFAATWLIEEGVPLHLVADQLGHESVNTTFNIYRRVNPDGARAVAEAMGRVMGRALTSGSA